MKWRWIIGSFTITIVFAGTVPVIPQEMKWIVSYETVAFETLDGDLGLDEYAIAGEGEWYIREVPKEEGQFISTTTEPKGKTFVPIRCEKCAYYSEFRLKSGEKVRESFDENSYKRLGTVKDEPQPTKSELIPLVGKVEAAVSFDNTANDGAVTTVTSVSWSHTSTTTADSLLAAISVGSDGNNEDFDVTSATYNSITMTLGKKQESASGFFNVEIWYLVAPSTGANTVQMNFFATVGNAGSGSISLIGVNQTSPVDNTAGLAGSATDVSVDIVTVAGSMVVAGVGQGASAPTKFTPNVGTVERFEIDLVSNTAAGASKAAPSAGTLNIGWTGDDVELFSLAAVSFAPLSSASGFEWGQII